MDDLIKVEDLEGIVANKINAAISATDPNVNLISVLINLLAVILNKPIRTVHPSSKQGLHLHEDKKEQ